MLGCQLPRIPLPRTWVQSARGVASARRLSRLPPVEPITATDDPTLEGSPVKLLREPLFWASSAAFVGVVGGLAGTFSMVALLVVEPVPGVLAALSLPGVPGYILAALSLLGVPALAGLGRGSRALRIGTALLLAWLPVQLVVFFSFFLFPSQWSMKDEISFFIVESTVTALLGSAAVLSLGLGAFFSGPGGSGQCSS